MKLTIKTNLFHSMLERVLKCASNNKMLPLTSFVNITVKDNKLTLETTDGVNYMYSSCGVEAEDFDAIIDINKLYKLISKTTVPEIVIEKTENGVIVKGNGKYTIELPADISTFDDPVKEFKATEEKVIKESVVRTLINTNGECVSTSTADPAYTCYYIGDRVLTGDGYKICCNDVNLNLGNMLINSNFMRLIGTLKTFSQLSILYNDTNVAVEITEDMVDTTIYGSLSNDYLKDFEAEKIFSLIDEEFEHKCNVSKNSLLNALNRVSIFISPFDKNTITLSFTKDGLNISNINTSSDETIRYITDNEQVDYACNVDIELFKSQVETQESDDIEIWYGNDRTLKLVDADTTKIVALSVE